MKIKDKQIKLYLIKRLENYNHNMDIGNLEYNKIRLEENKFYLFVILTVLGLILSLIGGKDFWTIFLSLAFIFEMIYILFSIKHTKIANNIIITYQKRRVAEEYIDRLLGEIDEEWDLNWERLKPIVTESMLKEAKEGKTSLF